MSNLLTLSVDKHVGRVLKTRFGGDVDLVLRMKHLGRLPGMLLGIVSG